jgi:8-oxo-dGTP pyrophosphatase MutT (NUDIX family)
MTEVPDAGALPPNAKRVFKGVIFEVWQWEQKLFDGSVATFEKLKRPDTVQVIAVVGDKILIQLQEQPDRPAPFPSIPGGRVDEGEEPLDGAKRELLEETGYVSSDWVLWKKQQPYSKILWTVHTFIARNCKYQQAPQLDAGEKIETRTLSFDELLELADNPRFYDKELIAAFARARFETKEREAFKAHLFGPGQ